MVLYFSERYCWGLPKNLGHIDITSLTIGKIVYYTILWEYFFIFLVHLNNICILLWHIENIMWQWVMSHQKSEKQSIWAEKLSVTIWCWQDSLTRVVQETAGFYRPCPSVVLYFYFFVHINRMSRRLIRWLVSRRIL